MQTIAFHNLGCKVNAYELDVMQQIAQNRGYEIVQFEQKADIYVVNTCSVTNIADRKSRQILHKAKKLNPMATVIAVGCFVQANPDKALEDEAVDIVIGNNKKTEFIDIYERYISEQSVKDKAKTSAVIDVFKASYENMMLDGNFNRIRADVKIQDGCDRFCTYCIIPYTRGCIRSRDMADTVKEVTALAASGYKEVVLTGIHISSYGKQQGSREYNPEALLGLIEEVAAVDNIQRVRIGSFEPMILTREFVERLSKIDKLCPHFHISLQSGSDSVLHRMNRHYNTEQFYEKVLLLREFFEGCAITTDIIAGFPGETEEEFEETKEFVKKVRFFETHIFPYSRRKNTIADKMDGQLSQAVKEGRGRELIAMDEVISDEFRRSKLGKTNEIIVEEIKTINDKNYYVGHTPEYIMVAIGVDDDIVPGDNIRVVLKDILYKGVVLGVRDGKDR